MLRALRNPSSHRRALHRSAYNFRGLVVFHPARRFSLAMSLPKDITEFLQGYPDISDDPRLNANLEFYTNKQPCKPDNLLIDDLHEQ